MLSLLVLITSPALDCGSTLPCLPGLDSIGIGWNAITGSSAAVALRVVDFTYGHNHSYHTLFGSKLHCAVPDQANVVTETGGDREQTMIRSVTDWTSDQATSAKVDAHAGFGEFAFSLSASTKSVAQAVQYGANSMIVTRTRMSLYDVTLHPPAQLTPNSNFKESVEGLPTEYNEAQYIQFVRTYGTHYVKGAQFGGLSEMTSTIDSKYAGKTTEHELLAQASVQYGLYGGGGSVSHSDKTTSDQWTASSSSTTTTKGGDPLYTDFYTAEVWNKWALSVETQEAPAKTQNYVEGLWHMVADAGKKDNLKKAILAYAKQEGKVFPEPKPPVIEMGSCDCVWVYNPGNEYTCNGFAPGNPCRDFNCPEGKVVTKVSALDMWTGGGHGVDKIQCCSPCFKGDSTCEA